MLWKIYKFKCDANGLPYGDVVTSMCYSKELMESYKNRKFVVKIEEVSGSEAKTVWPL